MYLNRFSVKINGKKEDSGYVEMKHGETYTIVLKNDNNEKCDAFVEIDGKDMGAFRINGHSNIHLERPANEAKKFTFYQLGTEEAESVGLHKIEKGKMGLIKVVFKPEKKKEIKRVKCYDNFNSKPLWSGTNTPFNITTTTTIGSTPQEYNYLYMNDNIDMDDCICNDTCRTTFRGITEPKAGGTGLSGRSNQKFETVSSLNYNEDRITAIYIRLIPEKEIREDPSELKPVVKSTPIPPPIYVLI
jgi:hypothetical protein